MPEEKTLPVPEHLQYLVTPEEATAQDQSQDESQSEENAQQSPATDVQTQILEALQAQSKHIETLQQQQIQAQEANASGRQYISELEQRPAAAQSGQEIDIESMTQPELVQYMNQQHAQQSSQQMQNLASQFGEMLELTSPDADMWKPENRRDMQTLMGQGMTPMQANAIIKGKAAKAAPQAGDDAAIEAEVAKRVNEKLAQNRSSNAGISGKPARNDATAPKLTKREIFAKGWHEHVVLGKPVPPNTPG